MVVGWLCVALLSAVLVEILQYIMKKITIFLISFNSHYISFHSSVFFLFEMCRWISKKQINYSLALPVSHKHLVNIIFISVISLSLSPFLTLSLFVLWFLFVAFTILACPILVESKKTSWFMSEVFSQTKSNICMNGSNKNCIRFNISKSVPKNKKKAQIEKWAPCIYIS